MTAEKWDFDTVHSSIAFVVRHMVISKVHGRFTKWNGTLMIDDANPTNSSVEVHIDLASVDTHESQRDTHLRTADFFDVEKFPDMVFKSTKVEKNDGDDYTVTGDLTLHGVTRPVVLKVEAGGRVVDPWGNDRAGFTAQTTIQRKDFGLTFNMALPTGSLVVGEKVEINIDIESTKAKAKAA
jgi:polyisoprenoid-binding protein YceI